MKKAMGRFLVLALCFSAIAAFAAPPKVGVCIYTFDDTFMSYVRNTIEAAAKGNLDLSVQDSQCDQPKRNDQVDQFLMSWALTGTMTTPFPRAFNTRAIVSKASYWRPLIDRVTESKI